VCYRLLVSGRVRQRNVTRPDDCLCGRRGVPGEDGAEEEPHSYAQRRTGRELGSVTAVADSKQTLLCTYLSAVLLVGLVVNSLFGWSWADPIAGLVITAVALKEDRDAWNGDACCAPHVN